MVWTWRGLGLEGKADVLGGFEQLRVQLRSGRPRAEPGEGLETQEPGYVSLVRSHLCLVLSHRSLFQLSSVVTLLSILLFDSLLCMSDNPDLVSPDLRA